MSGEEIVSPVDADGEATQRYVADFTKELPVEVRITYRLDRQELDAEDVVGKSGESGSELPRRKRHGKPTQVTYKNGTGGKASSREIVYIPLAATMDIILPNSMTAVEAPAGAVAGDGRGGTNLKYSITLIPPLSQSRRRGLVQGRRDGRGHPAG